MRFFANNVDRDTWNQICKVGASKEIIVAFIINYGMFEVRRELSDEVIFRSDSFKDLTTFVNNYQLKKWDIYKGEFVNV